MRREGVPFERTKLAWRRTILAATAVGVLAVRMAADGGPLLVAAALAGWVALVALSFGRVRVMAPSRPATAGRALPLFALATMGYAGFGVILVLTR